MGLTGWGWKPAELVPNKGLPEAGTPAARSPKDGICLEPNRPSVAGALFQNSTYKINVNKLGA